MSLVFSTVPALFMVSMYLRKPQENLNQSKTKAKVLRGCEDSYEFFSVFFSFVMETLKGLKLNIYTLLGRCFC